MSDTYLRASSTDFHTSIHSISHIEISSLTTLSYLRIWVKLSLLILGCVLTWAKLKKEDCQRNFVALWVIFLLKLLKDSLMNRKRLIFGLWVLFCMRFLLEDYRTREEMRTKYCQKYVREGLFIQKVSTRNLRNWLNACWTRILRKDGQSVRY